MRAHAIVIGIDEYKRSEWCLTGAVRDAVAFAHWTVEAGGVDPADLTLLLSPCPDDVSLTERLKTKDGSSDLSARVKLATREAIAKTFFMYQAGFGKDADRLWFYYAGHGLAPPAQAPTAGPLVVPADVEDLDYYVNAEPVGLETFRGAMEDVAPKEQFYFIDACRDVLPPIGNKVLSQQLVWDVSNIEARNLSTQVIFPATTAGQRAKELRGHGLFGKALLAALRGLGPELRPPVAPVPPGQVARRRLLFDNLVAFVKDAVERDLKDLSGMDRSDIKGLPDARVIHLTREISIAEFAPSELPTARLTTILEPARARSSARIEFLQWSEDQDKWITREISPAPIGPPVPELATFDLRGGRHFFQITAKGFEDSMTEVLLYADKRIPIELRPAVASGSKTLLGDDEEMLEGLSQPEGATGTIVASSRDPLARVFVLDGGGQERGREYGELTVSGLSPGPYRVVAELTSAQRREEIVYVRASETSRPVLQIPGPPLGPVLAKKLADRNIHVDGNYSYLSKNFSGPVANARLGSVLAYAAWAARWPPSEGFAKLRAMGVDPLHNLKPNQSAVQVLIGGVAEGIASDVRVKLEFAASGGTPLATAQGRPDILRAEIVEFRHRSLSPTPLSLSPLVGLPVAQQASAVLPAGPVRLLVEMPGFAPAWFAVSLISGFVTVLVIAREDDGDVDVQQYLNPIDPTVSVGEGFLPPLKDDVRLVELAWRALQGRDPLDAIEYDGLIEGKRSNPLLAIIAGYRMLDTDRADEFRVLLAPPERPGKTDSALWNLVHFFPGLPDVHVLAGLYDPARRDEHFARAMQAGTPVLVEGFWRLVDWLTAKAIQLDRTPPALSHSVLPGCVWTSFVVQPPAPRVESVYVLPSAGRPYPGNRLNSPVLTLAESVGRLDSEERNVDFFCSTFLVGPQLIVCPIHFALKFGQELADGSWTLRSTVHVRFSLTDPANDRVVVRAVRTLRPPRGTPIGKGTLEPAGLLDQCWPVLLELSEPAASPALALGKRAPTLAQRIAVVGFPRDDARILSAEFAQYFLDSAGEKHFMPGTVLRTAGDTWTFDYDCFTADGTSGGPVVDLETGAVVGMHVASYRQSDGRKRGLAVALAPLVSERFEN